MSDCGPSTIANYFEKLKTDVEAEILEKDSKINGEGLNTLFFITCFKV